MIHHDAWGNAVAETREPRCDGCRHWLSLMQERGRCQQIQRGQESMQDAAFIAAETIPGGATALYTRRDFACKLFESKETT